MQLLFGNKAQVTLKKNNEHYYTENNCEVRIDFKQNIANIDTDRNLLIARKGLIDRIRVSFSFNEKIADLLFLKRENAAETFLNVYEFDRDKDGNDFYLYDIAAKNPSLFFKDDHQNALDIEYYFDEEEKTVTILDDTIDTCYCFYDAEFNGATSYNFGKNNNFGYLGIEILSEGNIDDTSCYSLLKFDKVGLGSYIDFSYDNDGIMTCDLVFNIIDSEGSVTYGKE